MTKAFTIEVDCANCANLMEEATKKTSGVLNCSINFMLQRMYVEFADDADVNKIMKEVLKNCRKIEDDCEIEF